MRLFLNLLAALAFAGLGSCASAPAAQTATTITKTQPFVVAANPLAAEAGLNVLKRGGSAVDAAIAVQAITTGRITSLRVIGVPLLAPVPRERALVRGSCTPPR